MVSGFKNVSSKSFSKEKWMNDKSTRFFFFFFFMAPAMKMDGAVPPKLPDPRRSKDWFVDLASS